MDRLATSKGLPILLLLATAAACIHAQDIKPGMRFLAARKIILKNGWQPFNAHTKDGYEFIGVEKSLLARRIIEVENCAIDRAICVFNYVKGESCLKVTTHGEQVPAMRVQDWSDECVGAP